MRVTDWRIVDNDPVNAVAGTRPPAPSVRPQKRRPMLIGGNMPPQVDSRNPGRSSAGAEPNPPSIHHCAVGMDAQYLLSVTCRRIVFEQTHNTAVPQ